MPKRRDGSRPGSTGPRPGRVASGAYSFTEILISGARIGFQPEYGFPPALPARSKTAPWQASDRYPYRLTGAQNSQICITHVLISIVPTSAQNEAGTRAPGASSALAVRARDGHRALPGVATHSSRRIVI
jgi:hypothetical protein